MPCAATWGPSDWGVELMYGLPGQTLSTWEETVGKALALDPPHVSVDRMRRPARAKDGQEEDGEALAALRGHAVARLREAGYAEYVVDRFAKPGCASRHAELTYAGADEVGLGAGARSLVGGYSYRNVDDVPTYLACSADPERVVKDVAVVDDVARDLLAAARGVSCAAGFAPGRSTAGPQDGPARAAGAAGGASRRACALEACLDSLVRHGWAHKDAAGAYRLTDEGAFHKDEAYRALGACLAGI